MMHRHLHNKQKQPRAGLSDGKDTASSPGRVTPKAFSARAGSSSN